MHADAHPGIQQLEQLDELRVEDAGRDEVRQCGAYGSECEDCLYGHLHLEEDIFVARDAGDGVYFVCQGGPDGGHVLEFVERALEANQGYSK